MRRVPMDRGRARGEQVAIAYCGSRSRKSSISDLFTLLHHKATAGLRANMVLKEEIAIGPL